MNNNHRSLPEDLLDLINYIIAYEDVEKEKEKMVENNLEYLYDYSEYPEYDSSKNESEKKSTIIKISL